MSDLVQSYVETLTPKARGAIRGTAKLVITGEGSVMLDESGARAGDTPADVTLIASDAVFRNILSGEQNPVTAFMSGKLKVEGNAQRALKVSAIIRLFFSRSLALAALGFCTSTPVSSTKILLPKDA